MAMAGLLVAAFAIGTFPETKTPDNQALAQKFAQCLAIAVDSERLACLEREARTLIDNEAKGEIVIVDQETMAKTRRSLFGFSLPKIKLFGAGDRTGSDVANDVLETSIVAVRAERYGLWTLDLAEGGRWQTTESWSFGPTPRVGSKVRLDRGALGSYSLKTPGARPVAARRIN